MKGKVSRERIIKSIDTIGRVLLFYIGSLTIAHGQTTVVKNVTEFNSAVSQASPGGTIVLKNGIWENAELVFDADGVEGDSITLTAETAGEVILSGTSTLALAGDYLIVKNLDFNAGHTNGDAVISFRKSSSQVANHSRVTNCRILDYNPSSDAVEYKWVSLYGEHNRVDHCHFEGKNHEGALLVVWLSGSANYHRIDHNYFANIPDLGRNGGETIRIGTSDNSMTESRTVVEYNLFEACDGEIEIISNKSGFNVYRYNTFRDNEGTLTLRHGNDCEVYGNFFFGGNKDSGGVRIIGERHKVYNNYFEGLKGDGFRAAISITNGVPDSPLNRYFQVKNAEVVHNTIVSCKEPLAFGEGKSSELSLPPTDCIIANNVIDKTTGSRAITLTDNPTNFVYASNYINGTVGISQEGIVNADPLLSNDDGIWRPDESSPLIDNAAMTFEYVIQDLDGQARDNMPDVGSDELSSNSKIIYPLEAEDVGYHWEEDNTPILNLSEATDPKLHISDGILTILGVKKDQYPLTITLYSLSGKILFNQVINSDTVRMNNVSERLLLGVILDNSNRQIGREKVRITRF